jgi:glycosyltransferase involved in cell wall biosynthesis
LTKPNILFITCYFPPDASPGSARMSAHVNALTSMGWNVSVLCSRGLAVGRTDPGRLDRIPDGVEVHRTASIDLYQFIHSKASADGAASGATRKKKVSLTKKLKRVLKKPVKWLIYPLYRLSRFPDKQVGWFLPLIRNGRRIIKQKDIGLVFSSSPPHSSQLAVLVLRNLLKFKWITDWRDPWSAPFRHHRNGFSRFVQRRMEAAVLRKCDRIIVNTPGNKRSLLEHFPNIAPDKIVVVTNGFDTGHKIDETLETPDAVDCDIVYVGEVYKGMLDMFLDALSILRDRDEFTVPRIHVFGTIHESEWNKIKERGLDKYIHYRGFVSWGQSIRVMKEAKSLLLLLSHEPQCFSWVPSKVYPYIFSNTPILALIPEGDASDIVDGAGTGLVIHSQDAGDVALQVGGFVKDLRAGNLALDPVDSFVQQYSIERLALRVDRTLVETLES